MSRVSVTTQTLKRWSGSLWIRTLTGSVLAWLVLVVTGNAQTTTTRTGTDQMTPSNLAAGSPLGSYALSGFDNVNLFNGNLNFRLPMLAVSSRGSAGFTMMLALNTKTWHVRRISTSAHGEETNVTYTPTPNTWQPHQVGYGPGVMIGRKSGEGTLSPVFPPCSAQFPLYEKTITRLTFTASDGTEFELVDQLTMGQPYTVQQSDCGNSQGGFSRGRVWVTTRGEAATFISDTAISDVNQVTPNGTRFYDPSGYLFLRDGTRYRIDFGLVTWIQDHNGNRINIGVYPDGYDANGRILRVIDSLNRQITVEYDVTEAPFGLCDRITFKGFGGAQRVIHISKGDMSTAIRSDQTTKTYPQLFPELNGSYTIQESYNPTVVTSVWLPDGVRRYQFLYNSYGEVARVVLPTGGAYEYDYTPSSGVAADNVTGIDYEIYRRVVARRVKPDGTNNEGQTSYSPATLVGGLATVDHRDAAGTVLLAHDEHTFLTDGLPLQDGTPPKVILYSNIFDGMEDHVDAMDTNGTTTLRQEFNTYAADLAPWTDNGFQWSINARLTDTLTKLLDVTPALVSKRHMDYDTYNNPTNVEEYDFGSGSPGSLVRRSTTTYVGSNSGVNYATVNPNTTNPDPSATVHLRSLPLQQSVFDGPSPSGVERSRINYEYDNYNQTTSDAFHASLTNQSSISGLDSAFTTSYYTRGNVTKTTHAVSFDSSGNVASSISAYAQYDIAGNVVKTIDPRSTTTNIIATTFDFSDRFGSPDGDARGNTSPTELGTQMSYAFPTLITNALSQTTYTQFDYYLGKPVDGEDANQIKSSAYYNDSLDRPTEVWRNVVAGVAYSKSRFVYGDTNRIITTQSDQTSVGDFAQQAVIKYDGMGRTFRKATYEGSTGTANTWAIVDTQFDALGRVNQVSNPFRDTDPVTATAPSGIWTATGYDALSRVLTATTPDSAVVTTSYSGNLVLVTDQAGKQRISKSDGLGRLTDVWEIRSADSVTGTEAVTFPNHPEVTAGYRTKYSYDVLDDLITVTQQVGTSGSTQTRSFAYDGLKRLTSAYNPESGTVNYTSYDGNGNLLQKTEARNITTNYAYDALNRITSRTYSNDPQNTPAVAYKYDSQSLPTGAPTFSAGSSTGRLVAVTYGGTSAGNYHGYDQLGRVNISYQQTDSQHYGFTYEYDLASEMTRETYPSGRDIQMEYDVAGRLAGVKNQATGSYYAGATPSDSTNRIQYAPHGAVSAMKLGSGKWEHTNFNPRLQPTQIGLGTSSTDSSVLELDYGFGTTSNNGNVLSQRIIAGTGGMDVTQSYTYDALNRLGTATEVRTSDSVQQWQQTYDYDRYGNRAVRNTSYIPSPSLSPQSANSTDFSAFNQAANKIVLSGFGYDNAGNLTSDPTTDANGIVYDAENRQIQYTKSGQATNSYYYDGEGRRVKKVAGSNTTIFVYNANGQLIAEYDGTNTQALAATKYVTVDHLGSTRVVVKDGVVKTRFDYLPFGEELAAGVGLRTGGMGYSVTDSTRQRFTEKERDSESGLDYFGARYYGSAQGRFTTPDPIGHAVFTKEKEPEFLANPQRWDKYVYVLDNPLRYVDPFGLAEVPTWDNLNANLRRDLQKRLGKNAKDIWDNQFDSNKRQAVLNARAQLIAAGVWSSVTSIGFAKVSAETSYNSTSYKVETKVTMFTLDNKEGWELAITTNRDIRPALEAQGYYKQTHNHPEAAWQLKQPKQNGTDIVFHVLGVKAPFDQYTETHFDAGGGGLSLRHALDWLRGSGVTQDEVTRGLGQNPATAQHLRGISKDIDKLLTQK